MINKIIKLLGGYTQKEYSAINIERLKNWTDLLIKESEYLKLEKKHTDYLMKNFRNMTLQSFKDYLEDNVTATEIQYSGGHDKPIALHKYLNILEETDEKLYRWISDLMTLDGIELSDLNTPDELIYYLNLLINQKIQPSRKYRTDKEAWGKLEYWESAEELYEIIVNTNLGLDCDSIAFFKYHCFRTMLKECGMWDEHRWRLRCFRVNILGYGNHVLLGWVKEGVNDWLPIESTFYPDEFDRVWNNNMTLRNNYMYSIECSWDDENEYIKVI